MIADDLSIANSEEEVQIEADYTDEIVGVKQYTIAGYGADYDVEGIVRRLQRGDIEIPGFQRAFVWSRNRASRFIESLLMGLPVPGIFLYREKDSQKLRVIDGQQRLMSLQFYFEGKFTDSKREFTLKSLESRFDGLGYDDLPDDDRRRLNDSIIHASIIQQVAPDDNGTSQFSLFERINTTSTPLSSQEIRAAIYGGPFNNLLEKLNGNADWRKLFGKLNNRKRDQELILRFLALYYEFGNYRPPMKEFLNGYMRSNQDLQENSEEDIRNLFENTVSVILDKLNSNAFKPEKALNAALLDALMVGIARRLENGAIKSGICEEYQCLLTNQDFRDSIFAGTAQANNVKTRILLATEAFASVE